MSRTSTSSSRANARHVRSEPRYEKCPLCGSADIALGSQTLHLDRRSGEPVDVKVRRWACPDCGEQFLTPASRRKLDEALGLGAPK